MSGALAMVRDKVARILAANFVVGLDSDADFTLRHGSCRVFVSVWQHDDDTPIVISIHAPLLADVEPSPELFKHVALHADDNVWGHLHANETDGKITLGFSHMLLGDYLDEQELVLAVGAVLGTADELDDELQKLFGGRRFHEE